MFFSFLPSEALFPAAFFSSAEAFSPAVLSFPGRSLRPTLGPARCGTRYGVIAAHFQTNLRNSCKNRTPHPPSELHLHPHFLPPPAPRPLRHTPIHSEAPFSGNTRPVQPASLACTPSTPSGAPASSARNPPTSLTSSRYPASSLLPDAAETPLRPLPANAATFVSSSCRNHTPTRPRPRRLSCRLPHHRPPPQQPTDRVAGQCPLRRLFASRPSLRRHPFSRRLPPSPPSSPPPPARRRARPPPPPAPPPRPPHGKSKTPPPPR